VEEIVHHGEVLSNFGHLNLFINGFKKSSHSCENRNPGDSNYLKILTSCWNLHWTLYGAEITKTSFLDFL